LTSFSHGNSSLSAGEGAPIRERLIPDVAAPVLAGERPMHPRPHPRCGVFDRGEDIPIVLSPTDTIRDLLWH
jgi:hypothetical protein